MCPSCSATQLATQLEPGVGARRDLTMELLEGGELFERCADEEVTLTEEDCCGFVRQVRQTEKQNKRHYAKF